MPHNAPETVLTTGSDAVFTLDLGTLNPRPQIVIEAVPDTAHLDMEIEIELINWQGVSCLNGMGSQKDPRPPTLSFSSDPGAGAKILKNSLNGCDPRVETYADDTVDVRVRALSFGAAGAPASVDVTIEAHTLPPFNEVFAVAAGPRTLTLDRFSGLKDTTIYEDLPAASNGGGDFLWAGTEVSGPPGDPVREERRVLIAFNLTGQFPPDAVVNDVELVLQVDSVLGGGGVVSLFEVDRDPLNPWAQGDGIGPGDEFEGGTSQFSSAATWDDRMRMTNGNPGVLWNTPGGDLLAPALATQTITQPGTYIFSSPPLTAVVADMLATDEDEDGFLLTGPGSTALETVAVQFRSRENFPGRPEMRVNFTTAEIGAEGNISANTTSFISEGEDLRWIYDLNDDDIYETPIDGVCEVDTNFDPNSALPYTYDYNGTPGFTGHDCCTWQIDSSVTGIVGTGQAIFFHNLDPTNPANLPPDTDSDGIRDLCDNCPLFANGPLLGTCIGGALEGELCNSDNECGTGGNCHQSQEDADKDFVGDVCLLPEPGLTLLLGSGLTLLCTLPRRARR